MMSARTAAAFLISLALAAHFSVGAAAALSCVQCSGISCQRTTFSQTVQCADELDSCATVYDAQLIEAQGCLSELSVELRGRCRGSASDASQCHICDSDLCNNLGPAEAACLQCDSQTDEKCSAQPGAIIPTRCAAPKTERAYCFARISGEHVSRGCSTTLGHQKECLADADCVLCSANEISGCNAIEMSRQDDGSDGNTGGSTTGESVGTTTTGTTTTSASSTEASTATTAAGTEANTTGGSGVTTTTGAGGTEGSGGSTTTDSGSGSESTNGPGSGTIPPGDAATRTAVNLSIYLIAIIFIYL